MLVKLHSNQIPNLANNNNLIMEKMHSKVQTNNKKMHRSMIIMLRLKRLHKILKMNMSNTMKKISRPKINKFNKSLKIMATKIKGKDKIMIEIIMIIIKTRKMIITTKIGVDIVEDEVVEEVEVEVGEEVAVEVEEEAEIFMVITLNNLNNPTTNNNSNLGTTTREVTTIRDHKIMKTKAINRAKLANSREKSSKKKKLKRQSKHPNTMINLDIKAEIEAQATIIEREMIINTLISHSNRSNSLSNMKTKIKVIIKRGETTTISSIIELINLTVDKIIMTTDMISLRDKNSSREMIMDIRDTLKNSLAIDLCTKRMQISLC